MDELASPSIGKVQLVAKTARQSASTKVEGVLALLRRKGPRRWPKKYCRRPRVKRGLLCGSVLADAAIGKVIRLFLYPRIGTHRGCPVPLRRPST